MTDQWIILRCSNTTTIPLAKSLAEDGFTAWTPVEVIAPRPRYGKKRDKIEQALMPSFVFACADATADLIALAHRPALIYQVWDSEQRRMVTRGHPHFRVFRHGDVIPNIPEHQLAHLRNIDRRHRASQRTVSIGDRFRFSSGGFEGLNGIVMQAGAQHSTVQIDGMPVTVKMPTWVIADAMSTMMQAA